MTKARIKSTGKIVDVISRFMPKKRNAPSRDWVCNLSDGTCINESEIEYLNDSIQEELNKKASEYANKHYSEWEEYWYEYNGYNIEPENDKLELIDAFKAGAECQAEKDKETIKLAEDHAYLAGAVNEKEQMLKDAVEGEFANTPFPTIYLDDCKDYNFKDNKKVRIVAIKAEEE